VLARRAAPAQTTAPGIGSPFRLSQAIRFAALYALVLLAVEAAARDLRPDVAASAIALAVLSNTVAKAAYAAWLGGPAFRRGILAVQGAAVLAGMAALAALALYAS